MKQGFAALAAATTLVLAGPALAQDEQSTGQAGAEAQSRTGAGQTGTEQGGTTAGHGQMKMMQPGMGRGGQRGMPPAMMQMMFVLVDADGSGTLSLEEVLAVHERMFRQVDADGDGEMTMEEMQGFMQSMRP